MSDLSGPSSGSQRMKTRSPSFPAIDLQAAISRLDQLYRKERQHPIPVETAVRHWGYKGLSGTANLQLSALQKFGLLIGEGSKGDRKVRVSDLGLRVLRTPDEAERQNSIQRAALMPPIHEEMWEKYGQELPSDSNLEWTLEVERDFTSSGARDFVREYRSTMEFAGLLDEDEDAVKKSSDSDDLMANVVTDSASRQFADPALLFDAHPGASTITRTSRGETLVDDLQIPRPIDIPLPGNKYVTVTGLFPLSESEWSQFLAVLNVMKPGLVD